MRFNSVIILVINGLTDKRSEASIQTPLRAYKRMRETIVGKMAALFQLLNILMYDKFNYLQSVSARNMLELE